MGDLHPHWRATGDKSPSSNHGAHRLHIEAETAGVSRAPAAIVGIIAVLGLGITFFYGWDDLLSQIPTGTGSSVTASSSSSSASALVFNVTVNGMTPRTAIALPGNTVTIKNDDTLPHIFTSPTLRDGSGVVLTTQVIFPGVSENFVIYKSEVAGDHVITSSTADSTKATITILPPQTSSKASPFGTLDDVTLPTGGLGNPASSAAALTTASSSATSVVATGTATVVTNVAATTASSQSSTAAVSSAAPIASSSKAPVASASSSAAPILPTVTQVTANGADGIPVNPYTIATVTHDAAPASEVKSATKTPTKTETKTTLHSGANLLAKQQPKTGPELWLAIGGSIVGLLFVTRRQWKTIVAR